MKGWRAACWSLILLGIPSEGRAEFDQCRLIDQVLNRLGNAMAINRLIIAEGNDSRAVAAAVTAPSAKRSCVRPSTSWPPSLCRRTPPRWCSCSRRDHHQHDHCDQQDHQPAFRVAAPAAVRCGPRSSASGRKAAVLTDQPPGHGSVGTKPAASAVLADGDGQGLSISVPPACLV